ncbi:ABC transporter substrate-binding protein [Skermanella stibiiresistens SB22]|uniref:ABC transporter substrate-binding protein n=1 Tax=Skermanella stibiiresistens SB22 TaxID=1385369 RepID=W9GWZ0_9PROT|nr:extracellular solute-binding protein [Skermanella stibiiresistens]EWY38319.1 ABC transporter substrate-binding protein [Skermanella stibiiresistens SB22]
MMKPLSLSSTAFGATLLVTGAIQGANATDITVMGYRGAFQDNYVKAVIEPFQAAHPDIKVTFYGVQNAATSLGLMRAQKDAPQTDAVIYDLSVAKIARDEGLVREIDLSRIPNYASLSDVGKELGGFAPPLTYDTYLMLYNKAAFPVPPTSWTALWDKSQAGKIIIPAQGGGDIQAIALTVIANRLGGEDDYTKTIEPGVDKLVEMAPLVQTWEPKPDAYTLVANGTANLAVGYNARGQYFVDQSEGRLQTVAPAEGTVTQVNVISAVANSKKQEAVDTFIDYALGAEAQANFAEAMYYAPTNTKAEVADAVRGRIPLMDPERRASQIPVDWMRMGEIRDDMLKPWRRQIIPAGR